MLKDALMRIPDEDRCLLLLRELYGYSVAQLSEVTGLDEFAVRNRLLATRQRLVKDLGRQSWRPSFGYARAAIAFPMLIRLSARMPTQPIASFILRREISNRTIPAVVSVR
jgi:hypothetical protein